MRQPWSSVRCQWKVFSLCMARMSIQRLTNSLGKKCLEQSSSAPRQENRGLSSTLTQGTVQAGVAAAPAAPSIAAGRS